jgi:hypothetical protein
MITTPESTRVLYSPAHMERQGLEKRTQQPHRHAGLPVFASPGGKYRCLHRVRSTGAQREKAFSLASAAIGVFGTPTSPGGREPPKTPGGPSRTVCASARWCGRPCRAAGHVGRESAQPSRRASALRSGALRSSRTPKERDGLGNAESSRFACDSAREAHSPASAPPG